MKKITENDELATVQAPNPAGSDVLEALYDGYYDRIYAYCMHRLFCRTTAEDVTGQIFLSAAKNFGAVSGQEFEIHVRWLYGIATNQCNSYIRRHLRRRKIFEKFQAETNHYQKDVDVPPDWTSVYAAIAELKEIEQTVITLRFFEDMSHEEIAAIIKKRQNSVRVILHRGLKKLQKLLNAAECGFIDRGVSHERL